MYITKENIDKFIGGTTMDCYNMDITHIDYIPEGITHFDCSNNQLTSLPKLPESLMYFYCNNNQLISLPKLPESLMYLNCYNNNLPYLINIDNFKEHNNKIKLIKRKNILEKIRLYR